MPGTVIRTTSIEDALRDQRLRAERVREAVRKAQLDSALATQRVVMQDSSIKVDTGLFKSSWEVIPGSGTRPTELRNDAPYAGVLEQGARPFWPPLAPLIEWARRKAAVIGLVPASKGGRPSSYTGDEESRIRSFARAVQRAIARRGFKPTWIMRGRLGFARDQMRRSFEEQLHRIAGERM